MILPEPRRRSRSHIYAAVIAVGLCGIHPPAAAQTGLAEKTIEAAPTRFPIRIPKEGPLTLQLQILLDRAGFSPGIIDAKWGVNAAKAITFFTKPDDTDRLHGESPPPITSVDRATYDRLRSAARSRPL